MTNPTNTDLQRDFGRMEGRLDAMDNRLIKIESIMERVDKRLARIEARESQLTGAWWVLAGIAGIIGALLYAALGHFWK